jgi:polar amino acid transport system substrate-binding protein
MDGRFMVIEKAMGAARGPGGRGALLREFVGEMKASGFVARGLERSGQGDASVAA